MTEKAYIVPAVEKIVLVGTGGTGGFVAQGLAKMISGYRLDLAVALVDPDVIEEKNRYRQNFMPWEVGMTKAEALAFRLNQQYGLAFSAHVEKGEDYFRRGDARKSLLITCVDKVAPRKKLAFHPLWLDCGNDLDYGQVIFGTTANAKALAREIKVWESSPVVQVLPNPFLKVGMKELRDSRKKTPSCADTPFAEQGCFVNEIAAQAALTILHQILVIGQVTTPGIWFNSSKGRWTPARITQDYLAV